MHRQCTCSRYLPWGNGASYGSGCEGTVGCSHMPRQIQQPCRPQPSQRCRSCHVLRHTQSGNAALVVGLWNSAAGYLRQHICCWITLMNKYAYTCNTRREW